MGALRHRLIVVAVVTVGIATLTAQSAMADASGQMGADKIRMNVHDRKEMKQIAVEAASAQRAAKKSQIHWEYTSVVNCPGNAPGSATSNDFCAQAAAACEGNTPAQGLGPSVRIFRRLVGGDGTPRGAWQDRGITCFPEQAPNPARPALTMQMVVAAFHDTNFTKAQLSVQPKGNVTLVTLPTYFAVQWPASGFKPGEVDRPDPARMAGFQVEIRPTLRSVTYVYGDGTTSGPTTSMGGPYPTGDVTRSYAQAGTFAVRADVTYGGQFRVGGGAWVDIPAQVVVRGSDEPLEVRTAEARLVSN